MVGVVAGGLWMNNSQNPCNQEAERTEGVRASVPFTFGNCDSLLANEQCSVLPDCSSWIVEKKIFENPRNFRVDAEGCHEAIAHGARTQNALQAERHVLGSVLCGVR